jgi:2-polyprenyl-3-methyl-5-hydroxy-6-metoxy-1,4-benzoquinol methylase
MDETKSFLEMLEEQSDPHNPSYASWKDWTLNAVIRGNGLVHSLTKIGVQVEGKTVLDIGCGTCGIYVALVKNNAKVIGLDVDSSLLRLGKKRGEEENLPSILITASAQNLPFINSSFDLIISYDMIEHVINASDCVKEMVYLLRTGGTLYIHTPNILSFLNLLRDPHFQLPIISVLPPYIGRIFQRKLRGNNEEIRMFTLWKLVRLLRNNGFEVFIVEDSFLKTLKKKLANPKLIESTKSRFLLSTLKYLRGQLLALWLVRLFWSASIVLICIKVRSSEACA